MSYVLTTAAATAAVGEQVANPLGFGAALEMMLWLAVVIGVILLCAWGFRRLNVTVLTTASVIRVRSVISVGNRERIALLQVGDKQILVGLCPGQISTLHVFEENVLPPLHDTDRSGGAVSGEFAAKVQSFINRDQRQ